MQAYVSLWSADLLALGSAVDELNEVADGFHIDVFDGHDVPELLFGPDLIRALRVRTGRPLDVHLNVTDADYWVHRFIEAGATMVTVQARSCRCIERTLQSIRDSGAQPSFGLEVHEPLGRATELFPLVDRVLVMGTPLGVRGADLDPNTPERVATLAGERTTANPELFVDGGIRKHTVGVIAEAGADGVIPGSLVFGDLDPVAAVRRLHILSPRRCSH
jgi:ribulose-phosphate 3-epimerase